MIDIDVISRTGQANRALNPLHSLVYFAPECDEEYPAIGLRPGRMHYFASRSAPMGAVGPEVVTATFYNFNPELVARHIPRAWTLAAPEQILQARLRVADRALRRLLGDAVVSSDEVAEAALLIRRATAACDLPGRPLFAGHTALPWPEVPHLALWHGITLIREHRGDGHVAALVLAGLTGIEAIVTHTATGRGFQVAAAKALRAWSDEQWSAAENVLRDKGILDSSGSLTPAGNDLRDHLEAQTDEAAAAPWQLLGAQDTDRVIGIGKSLSRRVNAAGAFPGDVFAGADRAPGPQA